MVLVDGTGAASKEAMKALPVPGMQKPPRWVGKRFRNRHVVAPIKRKVKKPAGLKSRPAWLQLDGLKVADGDHLVLHPDSNGEGAGAVAQDRVGAVVDRLKGWNHAARTDPDEGGREQLGWQLAGQVGARIVPRQRRSRNMQSIGKHFDNSVN